MKTTATAVIMMAGILAIGAAPARAATQVQFHNPTKGQIRVVEQQETAKAEPGAVAIKGSKGQVIAWTGTRATESTQLAAPAKADSCPKCVGTVVKDRVTIGKLTKYVERKRMACDECVSAFANLLAKGTFQHSCGICGDDATCLLAQGPAMSNAGAEHRRD